MSSSKPVQACFESSNEKVLYLANSLITPVCKKGSLKVTLSPVSNNKQILTNSTNNVVTQSQLTRSLQVTVQKPPYKEVYKKIKLVVRKPLIYSNNVLLNSRDEVNMLEKEMDRELVYQLKLFLLTA